ncbi:TetR/AcrR family transcriptional regulator [soil metagenome]
MPRDGSDARRRLQGAALELFGERGYDDVTAAQIAARAGVTERTFFRHFKDKREVLFDGEGAFRDALVAGVDSAPPGADALTAVLRGYGEVEEMLEANRAFSGPRHRVIAAAPALQERMLSKTAGLIDALATALQRRGVDAGAAVLAAQVGSAVFNRALQAWMEQPEPGLAEHLRRAADELRQLTGR